MSIQTFKTLVKRFIQDEEGLTTVEYAIAGSLVGLAVVLAFTSLGDAVGAAITAMRDIICNSAGVACAA
ncbi:pilus assembly protein [uncultured Amphritea sp.]|uniref:Flp family type IVb pilin n=1 Tax=Amphritea sp. TaxID=1872502 RepID=UPI0025DBDE62|nr:pilus assembly protein [uncultured Amphritea sp.]